MFLHYSTSQFPDCFFIMVVNARTSTGKHELLKDWLYMHEREL